MKIRDNIFNMEKAKNKAEIFNKMKNNVKNKENIDESKDDNVELIKEIKRLKKEVEKSKSAERRANEKIDVVSRKNERLKEDLKREAGKVLILQNENKNLKNKINDIKEDFEKTCKKLYDAIYLKDEQLDQKDEIIERNKDVIKNLEKEAVWQQFKSYKFNTDNEIKELKNKIKSYIANQKQDKNKHQQTIQNYKINSKKRNEENKTLRVENKKLKNKLDAFGNLNPSYSLFEYLASQMNIDNFKQFISYQLISKKYHYLKSLKYNKDRRENIEIVGEDSIDDFEYGYLIKKEDEWIFININNTIFKVYETENLELIDGYPAKAMLLEEDCVLIEEVFEDFEILNEKTRFKTKKKFNKEKIEFDYIGDFKVLLIGSTNMNRYAERLRKHGLEVDIYDSYEESKAILTGKMSTADVVIYMPRHSRHIDNIRYSDSEKLETIDRDNEESIIARVRYTGIRLGLIKTGF